MLSKVKIESARYLGNRTKAARPHMGGATMGQGDMYPPPSKGEGDRGDKKIWKHTQDTQF